MTKMNYERHGDHEYGANRAMVTQAGRDTRGQSEYFVFRKSDMSLAGRFATREAAAAAVERMKRAGDGDYVIRKW
jgi:hypothetical protein